MVFEGFSMFQDFSSIVFFYDFRIDFGITFCSNFAPKPLQNLIKKQLKKLDDFCIDF